MKEINYNNKGRQMDNMFAAAKKRLEKYTPDDICRKAGVIFDEEKQVYRICSFSDDLTVTYPGYDPVSEIDNLSDLWYYLTILQYLDTADGTPLSGRFITLSELPGGDARSVGFQKETDHAFAKVSAKAHTEEFRLAVQKAGGVLTDGKGDVSCIVHFAPRFPVLVNFWEADDEFPASVRMYVDACAEHYLTLEAAGTACGCVINRITAAVAESVFI